MAWQPTWQLLVAFQNGPLDDTTLITTVASPAGTLGGRNVWTDITKWALNANTKRGREHEIDRFQAGTLDVDLWNQDGRFDNWNTSSPYWTFMNPGRPVRLQATFGGTTYTVFTGVINSFESDWPSEVRSTVKLSCVDLFNMMNNAFVISNLYKTNVLQLSSANPFWPLSDPVGSSTAMDTSGNNMTAAYNGTVTLGQPGFSPVSTDTAASLGSSWPGTGWVTLPQVVTADGFTFECWFKITAAALGANTATLFQMGSGSTMAQVQVTSTTVSATTSGNSTMSATVSVADGNWHFLTLVSASTFRDLYVDGVQVATSSGTAGSYTTPTLVGATAAGSPSFPGTVGEVYLSTLSLSGTGVSTLYSLGVTPGVESSDARIKRILGWCGIPYNGATIQAGASQMQAVTQALTGTTILAYLQLVELSENGALFMDTAGLVRFYNRHSLLNPNTTNTSPPIFGDNVTGGEIPYEPGPVIALDTLDNYTGAYIQRQGGAVQAVSNPTAQALYGQRYYQPSQLLLTTDAEALSYAQFETYILSTPFPRVRTITVKPYATPTSGAATTAVLGLELMATGTVNRHNLPGGGGIFSELALVESIAHRVDFTSGDWQVDLGWSSPADTQPFWVLGTSQLGFNTILAY